jgi:hypothetical protein
MYLVVGMNDLQPCPQPNCTADGHLLFNTAVVFDRNGACRAPKRVPSSSQAPPRKGKAGSKRGGGGCGGGSGTVIQRYHKKHIFSPFYVFDVPSPAEVKAFQTE